MNFCKITLIGHIGRDPELKTLPSGKQVCNFSVAITEKKINKTTGASSDETNWFNIHVYEKLAEICQRFFNKGSQVYVEGKFYTRAFKGRDGVYKTSLEVDASQVIGVGSKTIVDDSGPSHKVEEKVVENNVSFGGTDFNQSQDLFEVPF